MTTVVTKPGGVQTVSTRAGVAISNAGLSVGYIPSDSEAEQMGLVCDVVCTATAGDRVFIVKVLDSSSNILWIGAASGNVAATQTGAYDVAFGCNVAVSTSVRRNLANTGNVNVAVRENCPIRMFGRDYDVQIDDTANIDANDLVTARFVYRRHII